MGRRVLIIVENLPVPDDRRVWQEAQALVAAGIGVSVICPAGRGQPLRERREGVELHRYPSSPDSRTKLGYLWEYAYSWCMTAVLSMWVLVTEGFDALQACNPPDTYFLLAVPYKLLGKKFVFDHHDLSPELFSVRFARSGGTWLALLRLLERATFRTADHVITTGERTRRVALGRGGMDPGSVTVVRNGPRLDLVRDRAPRPELKMGRAFLCCWLGVMGPVDGVDLALEAIEDLVHRRGRLDCHFAFIGDGEAFEASRSLARRLHVEGWVSFPGWLPQDAAFDYLATADLGLQPDPKDARTDAATLTKTVEYMAFGLPVVAFDVDETRDSADGAAAFAESNDPASLAALVDELLADPARRAEMSAAGRKLVAEGLAWDHQQAAYVGVYERLLAAPSTRSPT